MLKIFGKLRKTSLKAATSANRVSGLRTRKLRISRQCDGERPDTSLLRDLAILSFEAQHKPVA